MTDARLATLVAEYLDLAREARRIEAARKAIRKQMCGLTFPQAKSLARANFTVAQNPDALSGYHPVQVLKDGFAPNGISWCAINFRGLLDEAAR
jgi:hypothetical protein